MPDHPKFEKPVLEEKHKNTEGGAFIWDQIPRRISHKRQNELTCSFRNLKEKPINYICDFFCLKIFKNAIPLFI